MKKVFLYKRNEYESYETNGTVLISEIVKRSNIGMCFISISESEIRYIISNSYGGLFEFYGKNRVKFNGYEN